MQNYCFILLLSGCLYITPSEGFLSKRQEKNAECIKSCLESLKDDIINATDGKIEIDAPFFLNQDTPNDYFDLICGKYNETKYDCSIQCNVTSIDAQATAVEFLCEKKESFQQNRECFKTVQSAYPMAMWKQCSEELKGYGAIEKVMNNSDDDSESNQTAKLIAAVDNENGDFVAGMTKVLKITCEMMDCLVLTGDNLIKETCKLSATPRKLVGHWRAAFVKQQFYSMLNNPFARSFLPKECSALQYGYLGEQCLGPQEKRPQSCKTVTTVSPVPYQTTWKHTTHNWKTTPRYNKSNKYTKRPPHTTRPWTPTTPKGNVGWPKQDGELVRLTKQKLRIEMEVLMREGDKLDREIDTLNLQQRVLKRRLYGRMFKE